MRVELDKNDLVSLVMGKSPYYTAMDNELIKQHGSYTGGHVERWDWDGTSLKTLTEEQLYGIYLVCKYSWVQ